MSEYVIEVADHGREVGGLRCLGYGPTRERIVRCRDCVFHDTVHLDCARQGWADCEPMGFCSWGMSRDDAPKGPRMPEGLR